MQHAVMRTSPLTSAAPLRSGARREYGSVRGMFRYLSPFLTFLLLCPLLLFAQNDCREKFETALKTGYAKLANADSVAKALPEFQAAQIAARECHLGPVASAAAARGIERVFEGLEKQRDEARAALEAKNLAEAAKTKAQGESYQSARLARSNANALQAWKLQKSDPTLALRMAEMNYHLFPEYSSSADIFADFYGTASLGLIQKTINTDKIGPISSVAVSPDGKLILTGSKDSTAILWNLGGIEFQTFTGHSNQITAVAFSPDGKFLLTGSSDGTAKLWDLEGNERQTFSGHTKGVSSVAFSPDGQSILTGSLDSTAKLWDRSGGERQTFTGHTNVISSVAFSPVGKSVLTGSGDGTARLWGLDGIEHQAYIVHHNPSYNQDSSVNSVAFSPDGKSILTGSKDHSAKLWNLAGIEIKSFVGHTGAINSVAFSTNGDSILTGSEDHTIKLWNLRSPNLQTLNLAYSLVEYPYIDEKEYQKKYERLIRRSTRMGDSITSRDSIRFIRSLSGIPFKGIKLLSFSADGQSVFTQNRDATILWNLEEGKVLAAIGEIQHLFYGTLSSAAFSQPCPEGEDCPFGNGPYLLIGYERGWVALLDQELQASKELKGHNGPVYSVSFSPNGQFVTGSADNTAKLWGPDGVVRQTFGGHSGSVLSVAFSPDSKSILTGSRDSTAKLWDLEGHERQTFKGHTDGVYSVAISPDGKSVLTGSGDGTARLWGLNGGETQTLKGHTGSVKSVVFSSDGQWILTGSSDGTARLWDLMGHEIANLSGDGNVLSVSFSPDGQHILTGSSNNIKRWLSPKMFLQTQVEKYSLQHLKANGLQFTKEDLAEMEKRGKQW